MFVLLIKDRMSINYETHTGQNDISGLRDVRINIHLLSRDLTK